MQSIASCTRQGRFRGPFKHSQSGTSDLLLPLRFQPGQSGLGRNVWRRVVAEGSVVTDGWVNLLCALVNRIPRKKTWGFCPSKPLVWLLRSTHGWVSTTTAARQMPVHCMGGLWNEPWHGPHWECLLRQTSVLGCNHDGYSGSWSQWIFNNLGRLFMSTTATSAPLPQGALCNRALVNYYTGQISRLCCLGWPKHSELRLDAQERLTSRGHLHPGPWLVRKVLSTEVSAAGLVCPLLMGKCPNFWSSDAVGNRPLLSAWPAGHCSWMPAVYRSLINSEAGLVAVTYTFRRVPTQKRDDSFLTWRPDYCRLHLLLERRDRALNLHRLFPELSGAWLELQYPSRTPRYIVLGVLVYLPAFSIYVFWAFSPGQHLTSIARLRSCYISA